MKVVWPLLHLTCQYADLSTEIKETWRKAIDLKEPVLEGCPNMQVFYDLAWTRGHTLVPLTGWDKKSDARNQALWRLPPSLTTWVPFPEPTWKKERTDSHLSHSLTSHTPTPRAQTNELNLKDAWKHIIKRKPSTRCILSKLRTHVKSQHPEGKHATDANMACQF